MVCNSHRDNQTITNTSCSPSQSSDPETSVLLLQHLLETFLRLLRRRNHRWNREQSSKPAEL